MVPVDLSNTIYILPFFSNTSTILAFFLYLLYTKAILISGTGINCVSVPKLNTNLEVPDPFQREELASVAHILKLERYRED